MAPASRDSCAAQLTNRHEREGRARSVRTVSEKFHNGCLAREAEGNSRSVAVSTFPLKAWREPHQEFADVGILRSIQCPVGSAVVDGCAGVSGLWLGRGDERRA